MSVSIPAHTGDTFDGDMGQSTSTAMTSGSVLDEIQAEQRVKVVRGQIGARTTVNESRSNASIGKEIMVRLRFPIVARKGDQDIRLICLKKD